jgi:preprotein translocase subunit YajC
MAGTNDFTTIRRGSRVRHTADGVEGKITWSNAASVKIEWDDGEKVSWKRAELADKGLELLDAVLESEGITVKKSVPGHRI